MAQIVKNADIAGLVNRTLGFRKEMIEAQSAGMPSFRAQDIVRLKSYINSLKSYKAWVIGQPALDLPKTHPRGIEVALPPAALVNVENQDIVDIVIMLDSSLVELANGQSADLATGLEIYDAARYDAIIAKIEKFLSEYVEVATPLDMPESAVASALAK